MITARFLLPLTGVVTCQPVSRESSEGRLVCTKSALPSAGVITCPYEPK